MSNKSVFNQPALNKSILNQSVFNLDKSELIRGLVLLDEVKETVLSLKTIRDFCEANNAYYRKQHIQQFYCKVRTGYVKECIVPRVYKVLQESVDGLTVRELVRRASIPAEYVRIISRRLIRLEDVIAEGHVAGVPTTYPQKYRWAPTLDNSH